MRETSLSFVLPDLSDHSDTSSSKKERRFDKHNTSNENNNSNNGTSIRKKHILLAATGSVASIKIPIIVDLFLAIPDVEVQLVASRNSKHFFDPNQIRKKGVQVWEDSEEWRLWNNKQSKEVLHIELRRWADLLLIAPFSADCLAKAANGICDDLLTCIVRAWDPRRPILIAPAMNTNMWTNPLTKKHLDILKEFGYFHLIQPIEKVLACNEIGMGGMAEANVCVEETLKLLSIKSEDLPQNLNVTSRNHEEHQYLALVKKIINEGEKRTDRTNTGTMAIFAPNVLKFSLRNSILPLLTTKRVFFRGVLHELLWFIRGDTNSKTLSEVGVHVWEGNGSREYLDSLGFKDRAEGDLGPVYGFQWRHFGAKYVDCNTDYTGQGVDQLQNVIELIKTDPYSRRIILSAWNPADLNKMALPPCHVMCQFFVSQNTNELSCLLFQRSCDMGLGIPFNIASYSLLTIMIAHVCNLKVGSFSLMMGDCHVYQNHIEPLKLQCSRTPREFPTLKIKRQVTNIEDFKFEDFEVENYNPHPTIKMDMSV